MITSQTFVPDRVKDKLHYGYLVTKYDTGKITKTYISYEKISKFIPNLIIQERTQK